jgi:hypothetical protein
LSSIRFDELEACRGSTLGAVAVCAGGRVLLLLLVLVTVQEDICLMASLALSALLFTTDANAVTHLVKHSAADELRLVVAEAEQPERSLTHHRKRLRAAVQGGLYRIGT